jgi:hypothetical protein
MATQAAVLIAALIAVIGPDSQKSKSGPSGAQIREDANQCVSFLYQFGQVRRDCFPKGLHDIKPRDLKISTTLGQHPTPWPPPKGYSWRVAIMPFMEEAILYYWLCDLTDGFKTHSKATEAAFEKDPDLRRHVLRKMPAWLKLKRIDSPAKSIYRRVVIPEKPAVFVVIETSQPVPWMQADDDLQLTSDKSLPKIRGNFANGFFALCGDGKVRFLRNTLTEKQLREALISGAGAAPIRLFPVERRQEDIEALPLFEKLHRQ